MPNTESVEPGVTAKDVSEDTSKFTGDKTIVQQQFAEEVDINTIMKRFMGSGMLPSFRADGVYGDFGDVYDYETALDKVNAVREKFMTLPADVRDRFKNDPQELLRKVQELPEEEFNALLVPVPEAKAVDKNPPPVPPVTAG